MSEETKPIETEPAAANVVNMQIEVIKNKMREYFINAFPCSEGFDPAHAADRMNIDVDEPNGVFQIRILLSSRPGKYPFASMEMGLFILPQLNQIDLRFNRSRHPVVAFFETYAVGITKKYTDRIGSYCEMLYDLLESVGLAKDPVDRFIKLCINEVDVYYGLNGITDERRAALWQQDMERSKQEQEARKAAIAAKNAEKTEEDTNA
jgi:hypothetical protein